MSENLYLYVREVVSGYVQYYTIPAPEGFIKDATVNYLMPPGENMTISESESIVLVTNPTFKVHLLVNFEVYKNGDKYAIKAVGHNLGENFDLETDMENKVVELDFGNVAEINAEYMEKDSLDILGIDKRTVEYVFELKYL